MRIAMGSDHAGIELKRVLAEHLRARGYVVLDRGTYDPGPADYADYAEAVGLAVLKHRADRGIVICGSGVGASVAANKIPGIRAGLCHDVYSARQGVEDDDMNVLVLGARVIDFGTARSLADAFLEAVFSGEPRHVRRLGKVRALEARYGRTNAAPTSGTEV